MFDLNGIINEMIPDHIQRIAVSRIHCALGGGIFALPHAGVMCLGSTTLIQAVQQPC